MRGLRTSAGMLIYRCKRWCWYNSGRTLHRAMIYFVHLVLALTARCDTKPREKTGTWYQVPVFILYKFAQYRTIYVYLQHWTAGTSQGSSDGET